MDDETPLEFDLTMGMRKTDVVLKYMLDDALERSRDEIEKILRNYGVPLVQCSRCIVQGDLPSHGSYLTHIQEEAQRRFLEPLSSRRTQLNMSQASADQIVDTKRVEEWLKTGAALDQEFSNAVLASDYPRVEFLLAKGADINKLNVEGFAPLHTAARQRDSHMVGLLIQHYADPDLRDRDGLDALAACRLPQSRAFDTGSARRRGGPRGIHLGLYAALDRLREGKFFAAKALIDAGAAVNAPASVDRLTPLMVIASEPQVEARAASVSQGPSSVDIARI